MTAFAWLAAALFAAYLMLLAALHVTDRSRNMWRDPVSDYAVGASRPLGLAMGAAGTGGVLPYYEALNLQPRPQSHPMTETRHRHFRPRRTR